MSLSGYTQIKYLHLICNAAQRHAIRLRIVTAFCQGVTLGAIVEGIQTVDGQYAAGAFDRSSVFSVMTGSALIVGYALLGSTWLALKRRMACKSELIAGAVDCCFVASHSWR